MDGLVQVIPHLVAFGPWAVLGGIALFLLKGELGKLFISPKTENEMEYLMLQMNGLFEKNLVYFDKTAQHAEQMVLLQREANATLHMILNEQIRSKG